jgi:predicted O-linked N-acetylglucosamine transferase (SPINDLY family)
VQVIWGDVFGSVGLPGLDALLTDAHHVPDPTLLSERAVALPHGAYFFQPPPDAPEPGPPPCLSRGYLTVGSFNRLDKINDPLLARWGRLMAALPGARLVVQARALDRAATRADVTARLARTGVDPDRVTMEGGRDRAGMMYLFRTVDVALDSDPWSGGLTVLELLWMGVPSVSLAGRFPNGRHAVSHLTRVGLADWIADTPDAYIARVVAADRDRPGLAGIRAGLRARLAALPLCDPAAYAAQLEDTYHRLWADHRAGRAPGTG